MQLQTLLLTLAATFATALPSGPSSSGGGGGGGGNAGSCAGLNIFNDGSFAGTCNFATQLCTQKNGVTGKCDSVRIPRYASGI
ncbi:hypothetical protein MMC10_004972 [Thelotrema lepadinum]|nr:hypothetical protein [Thelotrema lepadinum]